MTRGEAIQVEEHEQRALRFDCSAGAVSPSRVVIELFDGTRFEDKKQHEVVALTINLPRFVLLVVL